MRERPGLLHEACVLAADVEAGNRGTVHGADGSAADVEVREDAHRSSTADSMPPSCPSSLLMPDTREVEVRHAQPAFQNRDSTGNELQILNTQTANKGYSLRVDVTVPSYSVCED